MEGNAISNGHVQKKATTTMTGKCSLCYTRKNRMCCNQVTTTLSIKVTQTKSPSKSGVILVSNKIRGQNQNIIYHSPK